jgi:hypothetical protein
MSCQVRSVSADVILLFVAGGTITITDNYYCPGGECPGGGFTIQTAAHNTTALDSSYTMTDGTVFTGAPGTNLLDYQDNGKSGIFASRAAGNLMAYHCLLICYRRDHHHH